MLVEFECPECKGHMSERWGLNGSNFNIKLMYWHMLLNPGMAINELVLGQRQPRQLFVCKSCPLALVDRSYVHCACCNTFHPGRIWSKENAFWHWLGIVCPSCGAGIPCLWNVTSYFVLAVTAPIWYLPVKRLRVKWVGIQHARIEQAKNNYVAALEVSQAPEPINYKRLGFYFGLLMFAGSMLLFPTIFLTMSSKLTFYNVILLTMSSLFIDLLACGMAGLFFGFAMKLMMQQKGDPTMHLTMDSLEQVGMSDKSDDSNVQIESPASEQP